MIDRLRGIAQAQGESVNSTVLRILEQAVGLDARRQRLARYATWTAEDLSDFERALADQRRVDEELWR